LVIEVAPLTNLIKIFLLLVTPVSLTPTFGTMVSNKKQGYVLLTLIIHGGGGPSSGVGLGDLRLHF
jgi:Potassium-transporting ATPase A subunit